MSKLKIENNNSINNIYEADYYTDENSKLINYKKIQFDYIDIVKKNSYKINIFLLMMLFILSIEVINLISLLSIIKYAEKINLSEFKYLEDINSSSIMDYTNKIETIVNYICDNVISC